MPQELLGVYNGIASTQSFPKPWKKAMVALIPKGVENKYRPICILDTLGKLFEHLIKNKLEALINLVDTQYGFRKGDLQSKR